MNKDTIVCSPINLQKGYLNYLTHSKWIIFIAIPKAEMYWAYNSLIFKLTFLPPTLEIWGQNSHSFIGFRTSLPIYIVSESCMPCCFGVFQVFSSLTQHAIIHVK